MADVKLSFLTLKIPESPKKCEHFLEIDIWCTYAKKLFVMYLSLISSSPSVKKNYLSLLFSIFALKHSSSYFCFSAVSPATVQIYSFLLLLNFFAIYSPFFRQNSIKCSSESKRSHSAVFLTSIFFLFSKKFKNLLLISWTRGIKAQEKT